MELHEIIDYSPEQYKLIMKAKQLCIPIEDFVTPVEYPSEVKKLETILNSKLYNVDLSDFNPDEYSSIELENILRCLTMSGFCNTTKHTSFPYEVYNLLLYNHFGVSDKPQITEDIKKYITYTNENHIRFLVGMKEDIPPIASSFNHNEEIPWKSIVEERILTGKVDMSIDVNYTESQREWLVGFYSRTGIDYRLVKPNFEHIPNQYVLDTLSDEEKIEYRLLSNLFRKERELINGRKL